MQPEAKAITKDNSERTYTAAEQWDVLSYKLIQQTLAPKGYKEIKQGPYRGLVVTNISQPGLIKSKVLKCQKISAQLVRSFRSKAVKEIKTTIQDNERWIKEDEVKLAACRFWEFKKKSELKYKIRSLNGQAGSAHRILQLLENLPIK